MIGFLRMQYLFQMKVVFISVFVFKCYRNVGKTDLCLTLAAKACDQNISRRS